MCHRPTTWTAVNWNHGARTGFALNLAHRVLDVRLVPQGPPLRRHRLQLCQLPPRRLPADDAAQPRDGRLPDELRGLPQPSTRPGRRRRFNHTAFPLVGVHATQAVRALPQERRLQGHAARLRRLPPGRLPADDQPEPRRGGIPDDLRDVPQGRPTRVGTAAASTTRAPSRSSACTRRSRARAATRTASTRARRATASGAT